MIIILLIAVIIIIFIITEFKICLNDFMWLVLIFMLLFLMTGFERIILLRTSYQVPRKALSRF